MYPRIYLSAFAIVLTTGLFGQLKLEWLVNVSGYHQNPIAAKAFARNDKTIMFAYGQDVYHISPDLLPAKTYTSQSAIQRAWHDGQDLVTEAFCNITTRNFYSGQIKKEHCLIFFDPDPPGPFQFSGQSGNFYFAGKGKWIAKFDKNGARINRVEFPQGGSIMGIAMSNNRIFVSTYGVSAQILVFDTTLNLVKNVAEIRYYKLGADKNSNCYFLYNQPGSSVVVKKDSALKDLWTTIITDAYFHNIFLKGDSLFVTGSKSNMISSYTHPMSGYTILNPNTGAIIETQYLNLADETEDTELIVEMESDGKNLYGSGVRSFQGSGNSFVFKLSEKGGMGLAENQSTGPIIFSRSGELVISCASVAAVEIIVSDALGRVFQKCSVKELNGSYTIETGGWPSGLYIAEVVSNQAHYCKKVFIGGQ